MRIGLSRQIACLALGFALAWPCFLFAQPVEENPVKAAFVYNFIVFTEWPAHSLKEGQSINLCVNSNSPVSPFLAVLEGKPVKKRQVKLLQMDSLANLPSSCHVVFLDSMDRQVWPQIKRRIGNPGVLTISDDAEISGNGIMIKLSTSNNRIIFDIDTSAVGRSGLTMSSKLLRLARELR